MRKANSIKNFISVALPYLVIGVLGFIRVKFFLNILGESISSLNQLFNNLLAYLALAEGGVGLFVVQKYYKCFVENDEKEISRIFVASKKYFKYLALFIVLGSLVSSFFLNLLTNNDLTLIYMQIAFIIFAVRYAIEYYFYPPRFVIQADQKLYKINYYLNLIRISEILFEIILLNFTQQYLLILIPGLIIRIIGYPFVNKIVYNNYPFLKNNVNYDKKVLKGFSNILSQKISGLIFENTDVIIVSAFLNPFHVIVYTSYNYISKYLNDIGTMFSTSTIASLGNALYKEQKENAYLIYKKLNISFVFVACFFSICFYLLIRPFIVLWIGNKYLVSSFTVLLFSLVLYISIIKKPIGNLKDNLGKFKETKYVILIEALLNVILSIILVKYFKINGILIATILSSLLTTYWYIPVYMYKNAFEKSSILYFVETLFGCGLICLLYLLPAISINGILQWIMYAIIVGFLSFVILFILNYCLFNSFRLVVKDILKMVLGEKNEKSSK